MTSDQIEDLVSWYFARFKERTEALAAGGGRLDWVVEESRVTYAEVKDYAHSKGISIPLNDRIQLLMEINRRVGHVSTTRLG